MTDSPHHWKSPELLRDLTTLVGRRKVLGLMAGSATVPLLYGSLSGQALAAVCTLLPEETNGPYPADGTNSANGSLVNALVEDGIIREDIRESFAGLSGTAEGVPFELEITLVDTSNDCSPLEGYLIYIWQCTAGGEYSIYNITDQNFLRGAGVADSQGKVKFTTVFPGCYRGRMPHIHFEVYPSAEAAISYEHRSLCSQMMFADEISSKVYNSVPEYADSIAPFEDISLETDNVFSDNTDEEVAAMTVAMDGSIENGFTGKITIALDSTAEPQSAPGPAGDDAPFGAPGEGPNGPPPPAKS